MATPFPIKPSIHRRYEVGVFGDASTTLVPPCGEQLSEAGLSIRPSRFVCSGGGGDRNEGTIFADIRASTRQARMPPPPPSWRKTGLGALLGGLTVGCLSNSNRQGLALWRGANNSWAARGRGLVGAMDDARLWKKN